MKNLLTIPELQNNVSIKQNENNSSLKHINLKVGFKKLLYKLSGKNEVASFLKVFDEEIPPLLTELDFAFQCGDTEEIKSICHGLRSSLLTMEMYAATKMAGHIEILAGQNAEEEIRQLLPVLKKEINEAVDYISKCL